MNIRGKSVQPEAEKMRVGENGISLFRRCYDPALLKIGEVLQKEYPQVEVQTSVRGQNRLAVHLLYSSELRQKAHLLPSMSIRSALQWLLHRVPQLDETRRVDISSLQLARNLRDGRGQYLIEACPSDAARETLERERGAITNAMEALDAAPADQFRWSPFRPNFTLAVIPPDVPGKQREAVLETANSHLTVPLAIGLTVVQCTIPGVR